VVEVSSSWRPESATREKGAGSKSLSGACPTRQDQRVTHSHTALGGPHASEGRRDPPRRDDPPKQPTEHEPSPRHLYDNSDHSDADSLRWCSSKVRSTPPASAPSAPQGADLSVPPAAPPIFNHPGRQGPDVHVSLSWRGSGADLYRGGGWEDSPRAIKGAKRQPRAGGGRWASPRASRVLELASESAGAKRSAPKQGSSDRPVKQSRV
jgi:hypothetical protein